MDQRAQEVRRRGLQALTRHLGQSVTDALNDPEVIEVMLNQDGQLWLDRLGQDMAPCGQMDPVQALGIISTVAGILGVEVTAGHPVLECELPLDGSRFEAIIAPIVVHPVFAIRKKALLVFTLAHYVERGIMTAGQRQAIEQAILERQNILVCGGTGTGKTTLANAVLEGVARLAAGHRIVIIEDTRELQVNARNAVFLRTSDQVNMTALLRATMCLRPDRIVVGEVRDASALALLKAWNTGHPGGVGTVHANGPAAALVRIGSLIQEAGVPPAPELIAESVNVVVSIARTAQGRTVEEVARVKGWRPETGFDVERIA